MKIKPMERRPFYDYYDFFDVEFNATPAEVQHAWVKTRAIYSGEDPAILGHFSNQEILDLQKLTEEAHAILSNPLKRAAYNELLARRIPEKYAPAIITRQIESSLKDRVYSQSSIDGALLKQIRESAECTLEELSQTTKINPIYLRALEKDQFGDLPAPVFVRGYIAQISKFFGLDAPVMCRSYMNFFNEKNA